VRDDDGTRLFALREVMMAIVSDNDDGNGDDVACEHIDVMMMS